MTSDMASKDTRDNFLPATKDQLGKRAGFICSYPDCRCMTIAASPDRESQLTITGVAAHITSAASDGPRYDPNLSPAERSAASNGIWLCANHAKFIDDNPSTCTVEALQRWKLQHEKWVFTRVEAGRELFNHGITKLALCNYGLFEGEHFVSLGHHNVLVGNNDSGKTTFCQALCAFSGEPHWSWSADKFSATISATEKSWISASYRDKQHRSKVKISRQWMSPMVEPGDTSAPLPWTHIEVDDKPSPDWSKSFFQSVCFTENFIGYRQPDQFEKALRYLASVFRISHDLMWDLLRDEFFATSHFGHRFKRIGPDQLRICEAELDFYLPYRNLSTSQIHLILLDVVLKLIQANGPIKPWLLIFDASFFVHFDQQNKESVFRLLTSYPELNLQTLFCLIRHDDAQVLKQLRSERWINVSRIQDLTLHSFL